MGQKNWADCVFWSIKYPNFYCYWITLFQYFFDKAYSEWFRGIYIRPFNVFGLFPVKLRIQRLVDVILFLKTIFKNWRSDKWRLLTESTASPPFLLLKLYVSGLRKTPVPTLYSLFFHLIQPSIQTGVLYVFFAALCLKIISDINLTLRSTNHTYLQETHLSGDSSVSDSISTNLFSSNRFM